MYQYFKSNILVISGKLVTAKTNLQPDKTIKGLAWRWLIQDSTSRGRLTGNTAAPIDPPPPQRSLHNDVGYFIHRLQFIERLLYSIK